MKKSTFILLLGLVLGVSGTAIAQDQNQPQAGEWHEMFKQACGADIQKFCSTAQTRDDRHACVKANTDKFSDTCKTFLASHAHGQGHDHDQSQGQTPQ